MIVVGIGAGNPRHLTGQAVDAIGRADLIFAVDKGEASADLLALRRALCVEHLGSDERLRTTADMARDLSGPSYGADVARWHGQRADLYRGLIDQLGPDGTGAFLVWGDPAVYDSTLRVLGDLSADDERFVIEVVPGISAPQALAAAHGLALHGVGAPFLVTTGRRLAAGWPEGVDDVVVMLDANNTFMTLDPTEVEIFWGAFLGTADQVLVAGPLAAVRDEIVAARAAARAAKGWMFDTYLLRRRP